MRKFCHTPKDPINIFGSTSSSWLITGESINHYGNTKLYFFYRHDRFQVSVFVKNKEIVYANTINEPRALNFTKIDTLIPFLIKKGYSLEII